MDLAGHSTRWAKVAKPIANYSLVRHLIKADSQRRRFEAQVWARCRRYCEIILLYNGNFFKSRTNISNKWNACGMWRDKVVNSKKNMRKNIRFQRINVIATFCGSASHLKRRYHLSLGKAATAGEFDVAMHKSRAPPRLRREFFECCERESEREKTVQYFPVGIDRCPPGGGLPLSTAYLGNYVCHVCPFARFISHHPSRIHLSRSHAAFPPIEVGLQRSCVPKRKCCLNNVALVYALPTIHRECARRFLTIRPGG